jgi:plasmid stability protein
MPKMIQVRNVPDSLHRKLKSRAAMAGLSLSDFVLREMQHVAERPTLKELAERIASRSPVKFKISPAEILRQERESR